MFQQILYTQWKSVRLGLLPMAIVSFALPLLAVQDLAPPSDASTAARAEEIFGSWQIWLPLFPSLAVVVGVVLALNAWNWDHRAEHVYSLSLPVPRWKYVLLKMGAGGLLLTLPIVAMGAGTFLAAGSLDLPAGLHAYPAALTTRFLMAAAIVYGLLFAMASGTVRTTSIILAGVPILLIGGDAVTEFISTLSPEFEWSMGVWVTQVVTEWPGPFEVFFGNWNLIDV